MSLEWLVESDDVRALRSEGRHAGHELLTGVVDRRRRIVAVRHPRGEARGCPAVALLEAHAQLHPEGVAELARVELAPRPRGLWALGDLVGVLYRRPSGATYIHEFHDPLPVLATDADGSCLHVVGGNFSVTTDHGIEG